MGAFRHLLEDHVSIIVFRTLYHIPTNVEVRPDSPTNGFVFHNGWIPFWLVTAVEAGVRFPLHPLLRNCLQEWNLCPFQLLPNGYKIIMGVVQLNRILGMSLGVLYIEEVYDLCKSTDGNSYYLQLRIDRAAFVTALEDSYQYAGDDRVFVRGEWEFGESETSRSVQIPRKMGTPPSKGQSLFCFSFSSFFLYLPD